MPKSKSQPLCGETQFWQTELHALLCLAKRTQDGHVLPKVEGRCGSDQIYTQRKAPAEVCRSNRSKRRHSRRSGMHYGRWLRHVW